MAGRACLAADKVRAGGADRAGKPECDSADHMAILERKATDDLARAGLRPSASESRDIAVTARIHAV